MPIPPLHRVQLLRQENDYLVLCFLAEAVGKDLDLVLDAVLRGLSRRRSRRQQPSARTQCSGGFSPRSALITSSVEHSGNQYLVLVPVVDDVVLDRKRPNPITELRTKAADPGLFRQQGEAVDEVVDQSVCGSRARVLSDEQPDLVKVLFGQ